LLKEVLLGLSEVPDGREVEKKFFKCSVVGHDFFELFEAMCSCLGVMERCC
jgi:hypothetical protein